MIHARLVRARIDGNRPTASIGAQLATRDRKVISMSDDGGVSMLRAIC
jgi:thiamine pyrophosphate-dependent acetolactate synthase large subunit-like protein